MSTTQPRPTWITLCGIFFVLFGVSGIFHGAGMMATPWMVDMQKDMFGHMQRMIEIDAVRSAQNDSPETQRKAEQAAQVAGMFNDIGKRLDVPDWYRQWSWLLGLVSLLVGGFYLLAGILFLMARRNADRLVLAALTLSVLWSATFLAISAQSASLFMQGMLPMQIASIVIDIVLGIVVLVSDCSPFRATER